MIYLSTTIGDRISLIIERNDLKKVQFAKKLNIDQSYVSRLIKGKGDPSDRLIEDICEKFNVNENWLRSGEGEMKSETDDSILNSVAKKYNLSDRQQTIISCFLKLDSNQRDAVVAYFSAVADSFAGRAKVDPIKQELDDYEQELRAEQREQLVCENSDEKNGTK